MYFNDLLSDEELSNFESIGDEHTLINPYLNQKLEDKNFQDYIKNINEIKFNEVFEKEFNNVFNKVNKGNSAYNKEISPISEKENLIQNKKKIMNKQILLNIKDKKDKFFPFTPGVGIKKCVEKIGLELNFISSNYISLSSPYKIEKEIKVSKFKVLDYTDSKRGKIKKPKKKRKFKPDDIRKKIKARFHKAIKNIINIDLKNAGSRKLFDFFPQSFISNITIKFNHIALNYTYDELIRKDIAFEVMSQVQSDRDFDKYKRNLEVLNYIDHSKKISKVSLFSKIRKMKYSEILKAYFLSSEFEDAIIDLYNKGEKIEYIEEYINKSLNYVNFFSSCNPNSDESSKSNSKNTYKNKDSTDYE